jgi:hypothetical protein
MNKLYKFKSSIINSDEINAQGKVTKYFEVNVISNSEDNARVKGKVTPEYVLIGIYELGKDWN